MTRSSSPLNRTVCPEYFPNSTRSPTFTSSGTSSPSSVSFPLPTDITSPWSGFSAAVSGMTMPEAVFFSSSRRLTMTRSCNGRIFIGDPLVAVGPRVGAVVLLGALQRCEFQRIVQGLRELLGLERLGQVGENPRLERILDGAGCSVGAERQEGRILRRRVRAQQLHELERAAAGQIDVQQDDLRPCGMRELDSETHVRCAQQ